MQGKKLRNYEHKFEIIDLAGGTGDIAFRIAKKAKTENINCHINVVDINKEMLEVGKKEILIVNLTIISILFAKMEKIFNLKIIILTILLLHLA